MHLGFPLFQFNFVLNSTECNHEEDSAKDGNEERNEQWPKFFIISETVNFETKITHTIANSSFYNEFSAER